MLWENWRLTRVEAAWRLALGTVSASAVLAVLGAMRPPEALKEFVVAVALVLIIAPLFLPWISIAKVRGAQFGFPFYLLYTYPIRTTVLVGVSMAYVAGLAAAVYLVAALVLRWTFGYPFPLLSISASIAAFHMGQAAADWWNPRRIAGQLGVAAAGLVFMTLLGYREGAFSWTTGLESDGFRRWPMQFDFSLAEYALIAAIGLASFGVAIAGVARQRRGDAVAAIPLTGGFPEWLVNLLRFPCPTSSATRAQLWFDLKAVGLPVLTIGAVLAIVNPLVFAVGILVESVRPFSMGVAMLSTLAVLLLSGNAFGLRWKHGRVDFSAFDAAQVTGSARLAILKVLVRSACVLAALVAVCVSVWASFSFIAVAESYQRLWGYRRARIWQQAIESAAGAIAGYELVAFAVVASFAVVILVASRAALSALWARYPRRVSVVASLPLTYGLAFVLRMRAGSGASGLALDMIFRTAPWVVAGAMVLTTLYLFWKGFAERLLTLRSACGAILIAVAFGVSWVTVLQATGVRLAGMSTTNALWMFSALLLPLMASVLTPWSLSRIRHT
jgi:hypothetical protein